MSSPTARNRGFLQPPTVAEIEALAAADHVVLGAGEAEAFAPVIAALVASAAWAEELAQPQLRTRWTSRDPGYVPDATEDPLNLFTRRCRVEGAADGPLAGRTVAVKDNISVAGVPTTNGSRLAAYTPGVDAVVVERILDAGGTIVGKLNMDDFGAAGTGETSVFGPPRNPVNPQHSAGGSSGASGAAVRGGVVDLALGVDQGGSGRIPAASCGVVAMKATHGLVPAFGVTHIDHTIDFVTPIGRTVADTALLLEVIAGPDWRDPQWVRGELAAGVYVDAGADVAGMRVGVIAESHGDFCEPAVRDGVDRARRALTDAGAVVEDVCLPVWADALRIFQPYIGILFAAMVRAEGEGFGHLGYIDVARMHAFAVSRRAESSELAPQVKCWLIAARHLHERYMNVPYGVLQNLRLEVRKRISAALDGFDVLLTPTLPQTAPRLLDGPASVGELIDRTAALLCFNTAPLNLSGHPALSVPSGVDDAGLPTAVQVIAAHLAERTAFRAGFALEAALGPFVP